MHAMVTADFENADSCRQDIYAGLERLGWKKISTMGRDLTTVWTREFDTASLKQIQETAFREFKHVAKVERAQLKFAVNVSETPPFGWPPELSGSPVSDVLSDLRDIIRKPRERKR